MRNELIKVLEKAALEKNRLEEMNALAFSNELIRVLKAADVIAIGAPMYNWCIISPLKAYIDQVLRMNETWGLNRENRHDPYIGLLKGKTVYLLFSRGADGYEPGGYSEHINFAGSAAQPISVML